MEVILDSAKAIRLCWIPSAHELLGGTSVSIFGWFLGGFQLAPGHEGRMLDDVQAPAAGAHFGVFFFAHPEGFWSMNPWNLTASPWLSEDQNRRAGQSSEFGCLGGNRLGTMLNAELLARHLRFLRGFSCFGCFGKWMKINWLFIRKHTSIGWKLTFYHINLYFFVLFSWIFFHEGLPQVDFPA